MHTFNKCKRMGSMVLATSLAFIPMAGFAQPAIVFAEGTDGGAGEAVHSASITVEGAVEGHSYRVYQIFTGSVNGDGRDGKLGNVQYGQNYFPDGKVVGDSVPASELEAIADAEAFAKEHKDTLKGDPVEVLNTKKTSAELPSGYYLIMDVAGDGKGDSASDFIVMAAGDATFKPKSVGVPEFDKVIEEDNGDAPSPDAPDGGIDLAPETADFDWDYTLHNDTGIITLNYYKGNDTDVTVYSHYEMGGKVYKAELESNRGNRESKYMFAGNATVQTITFSANLDTSGCTGMTAMFSGCSSLTSLDVSCFDTSNVKDMRKMFHGCSSLTNLDVRNFDTGNVADMTGMFARCSSLTDLDVSGFITSSATDMHSMFSGCSSLTAIDVSGFNTARVTTMNGMFYNCSSLTGLDLSNFDTGNVTNMYHMFYNCSSLTSLDLSSFDTGKAEYMHAMFQDASNLQTIYVTEGKWNTSKAVVDNMFDGCGCSAVTYKASVASNGGFLAASGQAGMEPHLLSLAKAEGQDAAGDPAAASGTETTVKYGRGDHVPFSLDATMPESISAYDTYKLVFRDTLSEGLAYDDTSLKVYVGEAEVDPANYTVNVNGQEVTVTINDVKAVPFNAAAGAKVSVKYTATLDDEAAFRNINEAYLEYSNDPKTDGTGTTVSDTVTAFTFTLSFNKVDGSDGNKTLEGAGFTLYKKGVDGTYAVIRDEVKGVTAFSFSGLAAGDYKLVESTTPGGYNTMEDLIFTIQAVSGEGSDGTASVTGLKMVDASGTELGGWEENPSTGVIRSEISNYAGAVLPSTGSIGTTIFYVAGGMLVLAAGVLAMSKKKSGSRESD